MASNLPEVARPFQQFLEPPATTQGLQAVQQVGRPAGNMGNIGNIAYYLTSFMQGASAGKAHQAAQQEYRQFQDYNQLSQLLQLTQNPALDQDAAAQIQTQIVREMGSHAVEEAKRGGKNNPVLEMFGKIGEGLLGGPGTKYEKLTPERLNQITQQVMAIPKKSDVASNMLTSFFNGQPGPEGKKMPGVGDLIAKYQKEHDGLLPTQPEIEAMVMQTPHLMAARSQIMAKLGEDPMGPVKGQTYAQQQQQNFDIQEQKYMNQSGQPFDAVPPSFLEKAISIKRPGYRLLADRFVNGEPALIYETPSGFRDEMGYMVKPDSIKTLSQMRDADKSTNIGWGQLTTAKGLKDPKLVDLFNNDPGAFRDLRFKLLKKADGSTEPAMVGDSYIIDTSVGDRKIKQMQDLGIKTMQIGERESNAILARREAADGRIATWYQDQERSVDNMAHQTNLDGSPKYSKEDIDLLRKNVNDTVGAVRYNTAHASENQQDNLDKLISGMRLYGDPEGLRQHLNEIKGDLASSMRTPAASAPAGGPKPDLNKLNNPMGLTRPGSKPGDPDRFQSFSDPQAGWQAGLSNLKSLIAKLPPNAKLSDLMQQYAPKEESPNDPQAYATSIAQKLNLPQGANTPVSALKGREQEIASVIGAVETGNQAIKSPWQQAAAKTPPPPGGKALSLDDIVKLAP
jgi:hypothetical protein